MNDFDAFCITLVVFNSWDSFDMIFNDYCPVDSMLNDRLAYQIISNRMIILKS